MKFNLKWLFIIVPVIAVVAFVIIASVINGNKKEVEIKKVNYITKDNRVTFTFNETFTKKDVGEYDLYVSKEDKQIFGAFTYNLNEYEEKSSKEILDKQINYFLTTRKNMKLFKKEIVTEFEDKKITRVEYTGKSNDSSDCIYVFSTIDFKADPNYVIYINEVIIKKNYEGQIGEMIDILESAKLN